MRLSVGRLHCGNVLYRSVIFKTFLKKFRLDPGLADHHDGFKSRDGISRLINNCKMVLGIIQLCCCLSLEMLGVNKNQRYTFP